MKDKHLILIMLVFAVIGLSLLSYTIIVGIHDTKQLLKETCESYGEGKLTGYKHTIMSDWYRFKCEGRPDMLYYFNIEDCYRDEWHDIQCNIKVPKDSWDTFGILR